MYAVLSVSSLLTPIQLVYFASAAEALSSTQGEIEELSVAAEGEYRYDCFLYLIRCCLTQPL